MWAKPVAAANSPALWLISARGVRTGVQLCLVIAFARGSGPKAAGDYALALAATAPVFVLADLALRTLYITHIPRIPFARLLRVRISAAALALAMCGVGASLVIHVDTRLVWAVATMKALDMFVELAFGPAQLAHKLRTVCIANMTTNFVGVGIALGLAATGATPAVALWGLVLTGGLGMASLVLPQAWRAAKEHEREWSLRTHSEPTLSNILQAGLSVGLASGILSFTAAVPQFFLAREFTTVESGRYALLTYAFLSAELILNGVTHSWLPTAVETRASAGNRSLIRATRRIILRSTPTFVAASLGLSLAANALLPVIAGHTYRISTGETVVLGIGLALLSPMFFGSTALLAQNRYGVGFIVSIASAAASLAACALLVPHWGTLGALLATTLVIALRAVTYTLSFGLNERRSHDGSSTLKARDAG